MPSSSRASRPDEQSRQQRQRFSRQLGPDSSKIRKEEGRVYLWAREQKGDAAEEWFDITGSPLVPERFQYGIGRDYIPPVDRPWLIAPDDERVVESGIGADDEVIGFAYEGQARAYPLSI